MNLSDIVALAKAGYTPKQVKELLEMVETSPAVKDAKLEDAVDKSKEEPKEQPKAETPKANDDPIQTLINILKEDK